jgi:hypothetical protein
MDLLAEDGHVIVPRLSVGKAGPEIKFASVGRNQATTFTGFCGVHDAELFRALDTKPFDPSDKDQLFRLAYRSVSRELHATMEAAVRVQSAYQDRVKRGIDPPDAPSEAGLIATRHLMTAYETYEYRARFFDSALVASNFDTIQHRVLRLADQPPAIAVSSLFSFWQLERCGDLVRCALNIFPTSESETVAVFSYSVDDASVVQSEIARILVADGAYQKYEISKLIVDRVENMVIAPRHFSSWSAAKIGKLIEAHSSNIVSDERIGDHPYLMLF